MDHKTIPGKQGSVHYWVAGNRGDCLLFTHGATMDHNLFQPQMEYFSSNYKGIAWDVPLHGLSRPCEGFSLQHAADQLIRILDAEEVRKSHLIGQSMGGYICQIAALNHLDRIRTLTMVGSSPIQLSYYSTLDNWLLAITPTLLHLYPYNTLVHTIAKQIALTEPARSYALETLKGFTKAEIAHIMQKVYQGLKVYRQGFVLQVPLLITYGESDRSGKVQAYCNRWAQRENRQLNVIPHAAHNANMDNPDEFNRILEGFLRECESLS